MSLSRAITNLELNRPQQEARDDMYYIWLYEGSQVKRKVYAALALGVVFLIVLYPLWPLVLRQGVYYLSWGFLGLLGLFFLMAIFRVILFCATYFVVPPGLWLYPNLWEDVSFMDSFRPVWAWHEVSNDTMVPALLQQEANGLRRPKNRRKRRRPRSQVHRTLKPPPSSQPPKAKPPLQLQQQLLQRPRYRQLHIKDHTSPRRSRNLLTTSKSSKHCDGVRGVDGIKRNTVPYKTVINPVTKLAQFQLVFWGFYCNEGAALHSARHDRVRSRDWVIPNRALSTH